MTGVFWFLAISCFGAALTLSLLLGALAMKSGVLDHPDEDRKQQAAPVARLGGVAIALAIAPFAFIYPPTDSMALGGIIGASFLLGLWDDTATAPTRTKLLALIAACLAATALGLTPEALTSPWGDLTLGPVLILGSALWLLVFINAANFMDGSNGLSIGSMTVMLAGLAIIGIQHGDFDLSQWWFALVGAIVGFLIHNLRGKLYAGDAGALGLGALFAGLGLVSGLEVWTVATLALPFLVDVLLTLIWRAKHQRSWLKPHRDHAYQRLIDQGWGHLEVAILYWGLSAVCGFAAWLSVQAGGAAPFVMFWVLLVAGCGLWLGVARPQQADKVA